MVDVVAAGVLTGHRYLTAGGSDGFQVQGRERSYPVMVLLESYRGFVIVSDVCEGFPGGCPSGGFPEAPEVVVKAWSYATSSNTDVTPTVEVGSGQNGQTIIPYAKYKLTQSGSAEFYATSRIVNDDGELIRQPEGVNCQELGT